jgi:hypothetical protein
VNDKNSHVKVIVEVFIVDRNKFNKEIMNQAIKEQNKKFEWTLDALCTERDFGMKQVEYTNMVLLTLTKTICKNL